jgi:hypothetical protein
MILSRSIETIAGIRGTRTKRREPTKGREH